MKGVNMKLGELKKVDLRELWPHEALDFTKWLAKNENIERINRVVGLTLTNIRTEVSVGSYNVDIACEDITTGDQVVIENQLTKTDHTHLGQIITYASGLNAKYVIWIVKAARDEHQSAVEWLNKSTTQDVHFFLLELQVLKIGDSDPAVTFNVLEQPNDWTKMLSSSSGDKKVTERKVALKEFWSTLNEVIEERNTFNPRKPSMDHWYNLPLGTSQCHLSMAIITKGKKVRFEVHIPDNKELYDFFYSRKDEIEERFGDKLMWDRLDKKKASRAEIYLNGFDVYKPELYIDFAKKAIEVLERMKNAFEPFINQET